MATVLLAWELGAGFGHLMNLKPIAQELIARGHQVVAAVKDMEAARFAFSNTGIQILQAPSGRSRKRWPTPVTFADILRNVGFGEIPTLQSSVLAWRTIYQAVQPDIVVCEHSPTALLALRGLVPRRVVLASGFCCPPPIHPLPSLRPWLETNEQMLVREELKVLANSNAVLAQLGQPPLRHLTDLYEEVDQTFVTTFPELDPYPTRDASQYVGAWPNLPGRVLRWPDGEGKRLFIYLKPSPVLPVLLKYLGQSQHRSLAFIPGLDSSVVRQFQSPRLQFEEQPLDLAKVGRECDLGILNGTLGTSISMLLAGKPTLHLPFNVEQAFNATAIARLGAGVMASVSHGEEAVQGLERALQSDQYLKGARAFSQRYTDYDPKQKIDFVVGRIEGLCSEAPGRVKATTGEQTLIVSAPIAVGERRLTVTVVPTHISHSPSTAQTVPAVGQEQYSDRDLTFVMHVYRDHDLAQWCLGNLRQQYPDARVTVISEGDPDPRHREFIERFAVEYIEGNRLYPIEHGGRLIHRFLASYLQKPTRWLFKIDPDTGIHRRFRYLPASPIFGSFNPGNISLQGGCIGFSREAAYRLYNSGLLLAEELKDYRRTWARHPQGQLIPAVMQRAQVQGLISVDWIVAYCCRRLGISQQSFDDICCTWKTYVPNPQLRYAVTHPCKHGQL